VSESSDPLDPQAVETAEPQAEPSETPETEPEQPETLPDQGHYLKRWTFLLVLLAVWIPAAAIGVGLYYWWYHDHSLTKSAPVFAVLVFVAICAVEAILIAMAGNKADVAAIAIAVMTAPYAATIAAAVLHGIYYCDRVGHCLVGVLPY
jgi:phosphoglycerol transferase MdoB-like AlkP superfamily enzyme